ncbi:Zn-dependent hydrolase [Egbenema bharatensis]|uniref:Zn-dependent hydrolase n=1 Tax=Egbenema bharatensis TaxID=3463334 RepID=UPI003A852A61
MAVLTRLAVNGDRLNANIDRLAKVGRRDNGDICRLAFTPEDLQARYLVQQWMMEAGMTVRTDAAGNLIGRYPGKIDSLPVLATGSHIDTVPSGGPYDGVLGVLAGIEAVRTLRDAQQQLTHPIEVIVFTDEESSMIGCQAIAGTVLFDQPEKYQPKIGGSIQAHLETIGGSWENLATAKRTRQDIAAFVELHVEQGAVLEQSGKAIGVVQGVVGMCRRSITITGQPNHAGTTPMNMRQDALVAAAQVVLAVREIALSLPSQPVATVGYLKVAPNAVNIVPGTVELEVDMRDLSNQCLDEMVDRLDQELKTIAFSTHTHIDQAIGLCVEPTPAAHLIQQTIAEVCQELGLSHCSMPSRAGHDAMEMGRFTDMGMIFVPSQNGLSHSGQEYTSPEQCTQGADALLHTLMRLDTLY